MEKLYNCDSILIGKMDAITRNKAMTWEEKRKAADVLELEKFQYATEDAKKARYRLMVACRNPKDLGKDGKMAEAGLRLVRSLATNRPMNNRAFYAHAPNQDDTRVFANGKQIRLEIKTGSGDWYRTHARTVKDAIDEYQQENKLLVWKTFAFTIVLPFNEFIQALDSYNQKGAAQFFKSAMKVDELGRILQLQEWKTSKKKIRFLQSIARQSYNLSDLLMRGQLNRRG